jgi:hypothetical protein
MSKEKDFKIGLYELFNSGGTNGGLFIDGDDAEMLHDEIILLVKKLNIDLVSKSFAEDWDSKEDDHWDKIEDNEVKD